MWETLVRPPRGRVSARKFIVLLATLLVAVFSYIFLAPTAHAADASWKNGAVVYEGNTYKKIQTPTAVSQMPGYEGITMYEYKTGRNSSQIIYFADGVDPISAKEAHYVRFTLNPPNFSDEKTISITPNDAITDGDDSTNPDSSCELDGIGWMICPVSKAIAEAMDYLYRIISTFFEVSPLTTTQGSLYQMWEIFRNAANILFVIGFLVMIYGQISGSMLSNYTIKKLLPRIIIAAILVNVSYWICALAVDLSNILGYAVADMFSNLRDIAGAPNSDATNTATPTWANVTTAVLAGGGAAVAGAGALIIASGTGMGLAFLLLGALLPAIFAVLVAVAVLAARQALITVFVILAPLAFVAYLLPNTDEWFTRWRKAFTTMLVMFPAFSVIFGGAQLAGTVIIQNTDSIVVVILGMTVQIVPLFITPFLIKLSSGLLTTIANITNDKSKGVFDRTRNWANTRRDQEQALGRMRRDQRAKALGYVDGRRSSRTRTGRALSRYANPYDRAYYKDYKRREREGMKGANEAMSEGLFSQTAAGGRIHDRTKDAGLEKHYGEAANLRRWNAAVYGNPRTGAGADPYRSHLHHAAHLESGEAKLIEDRATAHAERDLQTTINSNAALRGLKIGADVDAAHAKMQAANVEAEGKQVFQNEVMGDRALRLMNVQTVAFEKEAAVIESTLQKRAEAHWERITSDASDPQFDRALRNMRLQEVEASESHKKAEAQWNKLVENIRAEGKNAPDIAVNADKTVAGKIKQLGQDIEVEQWATEAAKRVSQANMSTELKENAELRAYAGGIGGIAAANRIYAKAKKNIVSASLEDIDTSRSLLSEYTQKQLVRLHRKGIDRDGNDVSDNEALIQAAMQEIALNKGNNWALQKLRDDTVTRYGMIVEEEELADGRTIVHYYDTVKDENGEIRYDDKGRAIRGQEITDNREIDNRRDNQQLVADAIRKSGLKVASISQTDISDLDSGVGVTSGKQAIIRDIIQGKFDQEKISTLDVDELQRMVQVIRDPDVRERINEQNPEALGNLLHNIDGAQINPQTRGRIKNRERGVMFALASYLDPADQPRFADPDDNPEKYYYSETLDDGSVIRRHKGDSSAQRHEAPVVASADYLVDEFLNTRS